MKGTPVRSGSGYKIYTGKPGRPRYVGIGGLFGIVRRGKGGLHARTAAYFRGPPALVGDAYWRPCRNNPSIVRSKTVLVWQTVRCQVCTEVRSSTLRPFLFFKKRGRPAWRRISTYVRRIDGEWRTWSANDGGWTRELPVPPQPLPMCVCPRKDGKISKRLISATLNKRTLSLLKLKEIANREPYLDTTEYTSEYDMAGGSIGDGRGQSHGGKHRAIGGAGNYFGGGDDGRTGLERLG